MDDTASDSLKSLESNSERDGTSMISDRLYTYTDDVYKSNVEVYCDYAIAQETKRDPREIKNKLDNFTFVVWEKSEFLKDINFYCEIFNIARDRIKLITHKSKCETRNGLFRSFIQRQTKLMEEKRLYCGMT